MRPGLKRRRTRARRCPRSPTTTSSGRRPSPTASRRHDPLLRLRPSPDGSRGREAGPRGRPGTDPRRGYPTGRPRPPRTKVGIGYVFELRFRKRF